MKLITLAVLATILAAPAAAQVTERAAPMRMPAATPAAPCPATPAPLPAALAGWAAPVPLFAGNKETGMERAALPIGRSGSVTLASIGGVSFPVPPGHPSSANAYGGLVAFSVAQAGTYRVSLDAGAWIDVIEAGRAVESGAHGHGPDCTGVRKQVDFALTPGRHLIEVSATEVPVLKMMVTPAAP